MKRSNARMEEGDIDNERIPPPVNQVPIVGLQDENEEVPFQEPQVPLEPQETQESQVPQVLPIPQAPYVEGDMTNAQLREMRQEGKRPRSDILVT